MKNKAARIIFTIIAIALMLTIIGLYLYQVLVQKLPPMDNLLRTIVVIAGGIGIIVKVHSGAARRKSLQIYEKAYEQELGRAYAEDPKGRKQLLKACCYYNEQNYNAALKILTKLQKGNPQRKDLIPVLLFTALCYDDAGFTKEAIRVYEQLIAYDPCHSTACSNLGLLYKSNGEPEKALQQFSRAIDFGRDNYYAYNNRASCYFDLEQYEQAISDAGKALELKSGGREAAGLLAIIYAILENEEGYLKYYKLALQCGETPERLNFAINFYRNRKRAGTEEEEEV